MTESVVKPDAKCGVFFEIHANRSINKSCVPRWGGDNGKTYSVQRVLWRSIPMSSATEKLEVPGNASSEDVGAMLETFRGYLLVMANGELDSQIRRKLGASDLVQDTMLKAQEHYSHFRGSTQQQLLAWLREIMRNNLCDANRMFQQTQKRQLNREHSINQGDSQMVGFDPADSERTPRSAAMAREESRALADAMSRLPEDYRRAVVLRSWERLSFAEVGQQMNRSAEAARKLWFRAVEQLESELAGLG